MHPICDFLAKKGAHFIGGGSGQNQDGRIFFYVDDVPMGHVDEVKPGQLYEDAPAKFYEIFQYGMSQTVGPFKDQWGRFISAAVPILDKQGHVSAVLAMDIDATHWLHEKWIRIALPLGFLSALFIIMASGAWLWWSADPAIIKPLQYRIMPVLTCFIILFTVAMALSIFYHGQRQQQQATEGRLNSAASIWQTLKAEKQQQLQHLHYAYNRGPNGAILDIPGLMRGTLKDTTTDRTSLWMSFQPSDNAQQALGWAIDHWAADLQERLRPLHLHFALVQTDSEPRVLFRSNELIANTSIIKVAHSSSNSVTQHTLEEHNWHSLDQSFNDLDHNLKLLIFCDESFEAQRHYGLIISGIAIAAAALFISLSYILLRQTDRGIMRQQEQLRDTGDRLHATLQSIGDGVISTDKLGQVTFMNPVAENLCGCTAKDAVGSSIETVYIIYDTSDASLSTKMHPVLNAINLTKQKGNSQHAILNSQSGKQYLVAHCAAPIFDDKNTLSGVVLVFRDIGEVEDMRQREHERLLFLEEVARVASLFASMTDYNQDHILNQALADLGDYLRADRSYLLRLDESCTHMTNTHEWCTDGIFSVMTQLQNFDLNTVPWTQLQLRNGTPIVISDSSTLVHQEEYDILQQQQVKSMILLPLFRNDGHPYACFGVDMVTTVHDWHEDEIAVLKLFGSIMSEAILRSEERSADLKQLKDYAEQLDQRNQQLQTQQDQLLQIQKMEAIGQLASGVAHEINTPIQFIGDNLHFLQDSFKDIVNTYQTIEEELATIDHPISKALQLNYKNMDFEFLASEIPKSLSQSIEGVQRVANIVAAMKGFAHRGDGSMKAVDLNQSIESCLIMCRNEYKYVADVDTSLSENIPAVVCDENAIKQVLINVIVNAAQAIEDRTDSAQGRGHIHLATCLKENKVQIIIKDDGCGMPAHIQQRIFEPFFTTKEIGRGSGQGLVLVHDVIIRSHHGQVDISSKEGVGTTFILELPISQPSTVMNHI